VAVDGGDKHWAGPGDVIVLPYGDQHRMGGAAHADADVVCGFLHSDDVLFDPSLRAFPPVFVVRLPAGPLAEWARATVAYALAQSEVAPLAPDAARTRLPELLLVDVLRTHLASAPAVDHGWLAALRDPVLAPALAALHSDPARKWTVPDLAARAVVSRSLLDARFRDVLGRSPIRYVTEWRLHLARELLATTDLAVATVARRVGYEAEEAFSRAFRRESGLSPALWRAEHPLR
jgi:AraC-like DNA-binding protein